MSAAWLWLLLEEPYSETRARIGLQLLGLFVLATYELLLLRIMENSMHATLRESYSFKLLWIHPLYLLEKLFDHSHFLHYLEEANL